MQPEEFKAALIDLGFTEDVEDDPADELPSVVVWRKFCLDDECPRRWQQHRLLLDQYYQPAVLGPLYDLIKQGDCGHNGG